MVLWFAARDVFEAFRCTSESVFEATSSYLVVSIFHFGSLLEHRTPSCNQLGVLCLTKWLCCGWFGLPIAVFKASLSACLQLE
jgi:hypothetical protein